MSDAQVRTFLFGAAVGLFVMGAVWLLSRWLRRHKTTPPVVIQQIQLPVVNPTVRDQPAASTAQSNGHIEDVLPEAHTEPHEKTDETDETDPTVTPLNTDAPDAVEKARYHRQLVSLSLKLERVEQENASLKGQWQSSQRQLVQAESGLDEARNEIADIRGIILQLGATRADEDVIDLR